MNEMESSSQVKGTTFLQLLKFRTLEDPERSAYIFLDKDFHRISLTRQDVWDKSRKFAAILNRLGLGKDDIVCNTLVNSPERLITYFGTLMSGAMSLHGQLFLADGQDLIHNLKESKSKAIIYDPGDENGAKRIIEKIKFKDETTGMIRYQELPDLTHVIEIEAKGLEESERWIHVIDKEEAFFVDESISKESTAVIFLTSGTTGFSKLVPHTHSALLRIFFGDNMKNFGIYENTVYFNMQSLGWIGGFPGYYIGVGCQRILIDLTNGLPEKKSMGVFLVNVFNLYKVDKAFLLSRDIQYVLDAIDEGHKIDKQLNTIYTGGGPVHNATMDALGKIAHKITNAYGTTEIILATYNEVTKKSDFQDMCAGRAFICDIKIVGENGEELSVGEQGEPLVRSGTVFNGYLNNPSKTEAAFTKDGWYKTGDIGYFDKEGQLFVLCRKADVITKDGFCHYPGWMEQLIGKHPEIEKCVVIGIPDPVHHEEICLCLKRVPGAKVSIDDMRDYCKNLFLTDQDDKMTPLPRYYLIFDEFDSNDNGKVDRKKIRQEVLKRLEKDQ